MTWSISPDLGAFNLSAQFSVCNKESKWMWISREWTALPDGSEGEGSALPALLAAELSLFFFVEQNKTTFHVFSP